MNKNQLPSPISALIQMVVNERFKVINRCLIEGCRYGIEHVDKYPLDHCIYCGEKRQEYDFWGLGEAEQLKDYYKSTNKKINKILDKRANKLHDKKKPRKTK